MKILIAGGGKIGLSLVRKLSSEGHDVTLIDEKHGVLEDAVNKYDVMAVQGNCASMDILAQADIENSDLLIATMGQDEVNLLCCMTAHNMNRRLHTIARIRNPEYDEQVYKMRDSFALSMILNPERQFSIEIERLLRYPGFLHRESFAKDRVEIVELPVEKDSVLCNCPIVDLQRISSSKVLVCAVLRDGVALIPDGSFVMEEGDRVFVTAPTVNLAQLLRNLGIITHKTKKVMLCGGGRICYYLASRLQKTGMDVTIVEQDYERCKYLAEVLPKCTIINGDATNFDLLEQEGLRNCDSLVAMTGMDEMNMVIALYGHNANTTQVITKLAHMDNSQILRTLPLGSILDPKELCSNSVVRYVRAMNNQLGAAVSIHAIADGQVEAQEFRLDATAKNMGVALKDLKLKKNVLICCIRHGSQLTIPDGYSTFTKGDTVIVVTGHKNYITKFNDIFEA